MSDYLKSCEHVIKLIGVNPCPICKIPTNEINWDKQNELHRQYKEKNPNANSSVWWSI